MSIRPKRTQFCCKMLCFQQLTQLNLVIAVENNPTRANSFNLSDPAVVVNERAVTSRPYWALVLVLVYCNVMAFPDQPHQIMLLRSPRLWSTADRGVSLLRLV